MKLVEEHLSEQPIDRIKRGHAFIKADFTFFFATKSISLPIPQSAVWVKWKVAYIIGKS